MRDICHQPTDQEDLTRAEDLHRNFMHVNIK